MCCQRVIVHMPLPAKHRRSPLSIAVANIEIYCHFIIMTAMPESHGAIDDADVSRCQHLFRYHQAPPSLIIFRRQSKNRQVLARAIYSGRADGLASAGSRACQRHRYDISTISCLLQWAWSRYIAHKFHQENKSMRYDAKRIIYLHKCESINDATTALRH